VWVPYIVGVYSTHAHTHSEAEHTPSFSARFGKQFEKYVSSIVDEFYSSNTDINYDTELQVWAADINSYQWLPRIFWCP